jgi:hypothetical protein
MAYMTLSDMAGARQIDALGYYQALASDVMVADLLLWDTRRSGSVKYKRVDTLPEAAFLGYGETGSDAALDPHTFSLDCKLLSYQFSIDYLEADKVEGGRARELVDQRMAAATSIGKTFNRYFFNGSIATDPRQFNGLKVLCEDEVAEVSMADNGDVLSCAKLDDAIHLAERCNSDRNRMAIFANQTQVEKLTALVAAENAMNLNWKDAGSDVLRYKGIPVIVVRDSAGGSAILDFNETQGSCDECSSLYVVSFARNPRDAGIWGVQQGAPEEGIDRTTIGETRLVRWGTGVATNHRYAAVRLKGIKAA